LRENFLDLFQLRSKDLTLCCQLIPLKEILAKEQFPERNFSKRTIRQLVRKHLHNVRLKGELKIIAGEKDEYIIKKRKGIELEIEEEEDEEF